MAGPPNHQLRAAREATPSTRHPGTALTRTELAERVNEHVWDHHQIHSPVDRKYIARLETGRVRWPNARYRQAFRDILKAGTDAELGFVSTQALRAAKPLEVPATADLQEMPFTPQGAIRALTAVVEVDPMDRRSFLGLSGTSLATLAFDWLVAPPGATTEQHTGRTVTHRQVDALDDITGQLRRLDDHHGGGAVTDLAHAQLAYARRLLHDGAYADSVGRRLHATAAELLRFTGWLAWDNGNHPHAHRHWAAALRTSHAAGDNRIGANVLAFWACEALERTHYHDAFSLTSAARLRSIASPRVAAIVNLCHAEAAAALGEHRECLTAIDRAQHHLDTNAPDQPTWAYWVEDNAHEMIGRALLRLGHTDTAIDHLNLFVNAAPPGRERIRGQAYLARAFLAAGEPHQAAQTGIDAIGILDTNINSRRSIELLRALRPELPTTGPEINEFTERLALL